MKSTVVSKQIMLKTELHMLPNLMQCTCAVKAAQVNKLDNKGSELNYIKNGPTFQRSSPIVTMHICLLERCNNPIKRWALCAAVWLRLRCPGDNQGGPEGPVPLHKPGLRSGDLLRGLRLPGGVR